MSDRQIIPADQILPNRLFIMPLTGKPIFPVIFTPIMIQDEQDIEVIDKAMNGDSMIGLSLTQESVEEESSEKYELDLHRIGTAAKIVKKINLPDGGYNIFISTLKRFRAKKFIRQEDRPVAAAAEYLEDTNAESDEVKALTRSLISEMKQVSE